MEVNVQDVNAAPSDRLLFLPESVERKGLLRQTEVAMAQRPANAYRPWCGLSYLPVISEAEIDQRLQNHIARAFLGPALEPSIDRVSYAATSYMSRHGHRPAAHAAFH